MALGINFDNDAIGSAPVDWSCGVTGSGSARWAVTADPSAPSKANVLMQSGRGAFPWCIKSGTAVADGFVKVKFKAISGRQDQAGGVVWRWKGGDKYYVARANALENNISLYYTEGGSRKTLKYVDAPVRLGTWHTLRVEFAGTRIAVSLNGVLSRNRRKFRQPINVACPAPGRWGRPNSRVTSRHFDHGNASRTSRPDCSGLDEAD